jgi:hypothetical protein
MIGFIKQQEKKLAVRLLTWQYQKKNIPIPPATELDDQAMLIVNEAHRIARDRGRNVVSILKELVSDIRKP